MARKKYKKYQVKTPLDYVSMPKFDIDPEIKRGIFVVAVLAFGAVSLLSLFNLSGVLGGYINQLLTLLFGWGRWFFPVIFLAIGYLLYHKEKRGVKGATYLGIFLFVLSIHAIFHLFIDQERWQEVIDLGQGGGYMGLLLASVSIKLMGFYAALIVLFGLLVVSLMLMFNKPISSLFGRESLLAKIFYPFNFILIKLFTRTENSAQQQEDSYNDVQDEEEEEADPEENNFSVEPIKDEPTFIKTIKEKIKPQPVKEKEWKPSNLVIDLPLDLLTIKGGKPTSGDIKNNIEIIRRTLENFGIPSEMGEVAIGPTVTQYTFKPAEGIKLSKITTLNNNLALALAAQSIRIEAPIPGKSLVGVEVPNQTAAMVGLREILASDDFKERKSDLMLALGKDVSGRSWMYDLTRMPHLLVAGATNSGKSVCLNAMIIGLLYQNNPDDLRFIMVDPKRVELTGYNDIPHLLTPVITDVPKTINALKWCLNEMDRRFDVLKEKRKRNIKDYNEVAKEKMPYIVFVIDELADLMLLARKDIEGSLIRLLQMARAVGIHLILATQRPSVDIITGLIKANMPARVAFSVNSGVDSKTILDTMGAEKLLGKGDMLFTTAELPKPKRIQGAFLSDREIKNILGYIKEKAGEPNYIEGITERQKVTGMGGHGLDSSGGGDGGDELLEEAKEIIINSGKASTSYLQRRMSIGYARAAKLIDMLEEVGVVGPANGSKPREIMISKEQYEAIVDQGVSGVSVHNRDEAVAPESYLGGEDEDEDLQDQESEDDVIESKEDLSAEALAQADEAEEYIDAEDDLLEEIHDSSIGTDHEQKDKLTQTEKAGLDEVYSEDKKEKKPPEKKIIRNLDNEDFDKLFSR
ncbi:MAG: cell division FtsK/SpoIIIE [Parcubacteria group bacterium GW2011_GWE2_38_18]|nr:MAG: cell division FtsK/SpoIIIE [Parcubacteria group bacterium GW2011_GWE2_38_18]